MLLGILLAFVILICIALAGVVLLQRSEGGALGMGGGPSGFMTARGAGDLLTRMTWILGSLLFAMCLVMTILQGRLSKGASVVDRLKIAPLSSDALRPTAPPATAPGAQPGAPAAPPADDGFGPPPPTVNVAPATAAPAAQPATAAPGAVTLRPATRSAPPAAAPQPPAPSVTVAPARGASRTQTPPATNTGPTDPVAATVGGTPTTDAPAPKPN